MSFPVAEAVDDAGWHQEEMLETPPAKGPSRIKNIDYVAPKSEVLLCHHPRPLELKRS